MKLHFISKAIALLSLLTVSSVLLVEEAAPRIEPSQKGQGIIIGLGCMLIQNGIWYLWKQWTKPNYKPTN